MGSHRLYYFGFISFFDIIPPPPPTGTPPNLGGDFRRNYSSALNLRLFLGGVPESARGRWCA